MSFWYQRISGRPFRCLDNHEIRARIVTLDRIFIKGTACGPGDKFQTCQGLVCICMMSVTKVVRLSIAKSEGSLCEKVPRVNFYAVPLSPLDVGLLPPSSSSLRISSSFSSLHTSSSSFSASFPSSCCGETFQAHYVCRILHALLSLPLTAFLAFLSNKFVFRYRYFRKRHPNIILGDNLICA